MTASFRHIARLRFWYEVYSVVFSLLLPSTPARHRPHDPPPDPGPVLVCLTMTAPEVACLYTRAYRFQSVYFVCVRLTPSLPWVLRSYHTVAPGCLWCSCPRLLLLLLLLLLFAVVRHVLAVPGGPADAPARPDAVGGLLSPHHGHAVHHGRRRGHGVRHHHAPLIPRALLPLSVHQSRLL